MAQQTQIATVLEYYSRWLDRFPTVEALAQADSETVHEYWAGLGYYRRAALMHQTARIVAEKGWPTTAQELQKLPGIGAYTSAAIASICFGEPVALADVNVARVFSRVEMCADTANALLEKSRTWSSKLMEEASPGDWNQAMMELGALVCKPVRGDGLLAQLERCQTCPLSTLCKAFQNNVVNQFPKAAPKPSKIEIKVYLGICLRDGKVGLCTPSRWWKGLMQFPELKEPEGQYLGSYPATITHHKITFEAYLVESHEAIETWESLEYARLPSPLRRIANDLKVRIERAPAIH